MFTKGFKKSISVLCLILTIIMALSSVSMVCFAEEAPVAEGTETTEAVITEPMQEVLDLIEKIPTDPEKVTLKNKDDIIDIKTKHEALTDDEKIAFPEDKFLIYSQDYTALAPLLITDIAERLDKLGRVKASDKEEVLDINKEYEALDDDAKEAISEDIVKKLKKAVKTVNNKDGNSSGLKVSVELIIVIVLSVIVIFNSVLFAIVLIRLLRYKPGKNEDYEEYDEDEEESNEEE